MNRLTRYIYADKPTQRSLVTPCPASSWLYCLFGAQPLCFFGRALLRGESAPASNNASAMFCWPSLTIRRQLRCTRRAIEIHSLSWKRGPCSSQRSESLCTWRKNFVPFRKPKPPFSNLGKAIGYKPARRGSTSQESSEKRDYRLYTLDYRLSTLGLRYERLRLRLRLHLSVERTQIPRNL